MHSTTPAATVVLLALISSAHAGTYLSGPLPSEFGGGILVDAGIFKNVQSASKESAKLVAAIEKCYASGAANFAKGKPTRIAECLNDPAKGVLAKYQAKIARIATNAPGLPPCADFPGRGEQIAALVQSFNSQTYCDAPPTPTPVPPTPTPTPDITPSPPPLPNISGTWSGSWSSVLPSIFGSVSATFMQSGSDVTGTMTISGSPCFENGTVTGTVIDDQLSTGVLLEGGQTVNFSATISGVEMAGEYQVVSGPCLDHGFWTVTRE